MKTIHPGRTENARLSAGHWGGRRSRTAGRLSFDLGRYRFQPAWAMTLLTLVLTLLLLTLGFWQLERAAGKIQLIDGYNERSVLPTLNLNNTELGNPDLGNRQARVTGHYAPATPWILLNNQTRRGQIGFHRLALFQLADSDQYLLVNRGWLPAAADGGPLLPESRDDASRETLQGLLIDTPRFGLQLGEPYYRRGAQVMELPYLDPGWLGQQLDITLASYILVTDPLLIDRYREQRSSSWLNPQRHQGYAFQWFSLALALLVIYLVTNLKRRAH